MPVLLWLRRMFSSISLRTLAGSSERRAFPVFDAEAVQGELAEAEATAFLDGAAHTLDAAAVALDARQAALLRPAAVAVHDDGDVPRQPLGVEAGGLEALKGIGGETNSAGQHYTV